MLGLGAPGGALGTVAGGRASPVSLPPLHPQMLSFMHAQYSFFQQGYSLLHQLEPYMKKLAAEVSLRGGEARASVRGGGPLPSLYPSPQLDQLVIDSAVEKREMERKHAAIQQRVRPCSLGLPVEGPSALSKLWTWETATKTHSPSLPRPAHAQADSDPPWKSSQRWESSSFRVSAQ